jgi:hypothetical protein
MINRLTIATLITALATFAVSSPAAAQSTPTLESEVEATSPISGELPTRLKRVTLQFTDAPAVEVLQAIGKQCGLGLVINAPGELTGKKLTLNLVKWPAIQAVEIVLRSAGLKADYRDKVLFVGPDPRATAAVQIAATSIAPQSKPGPAAKPDSGLNKADVDERVNRRQSRKWERKWKKKRKWKKSNDRVQFGHSIRIEADETVKDAVSFGGSVTVAGRVLKDAVSFGNSVILEPGGVIEGNAVAFGGSIVVPPGAVLEGDQVAFGGFSLPFGDNDDEASSDENDDSSSSFLPFAVTGALFGIAGLFGLLAALLRGVMLFIIGMLLVWLVPARIEKTCQTLTEQTGYSFLAGIALLFGFVPLIIILAIMVIGIPLIPVAILALVALVIFGLTAFFAWIGYKIPLFDSRKSLFGAMALGLLACIAISAIPYFGIFFLIVTGFMAAGAALVSRFGTTPR